MIGGLLAYDVVIVTPGEAVDRYGNVIKSWSSATRETVKGWVSLNSHDEDDTRREAQVSEWMAWFNPDTDITGADRIVWDGITFEVDGPPVKRRTPRGVHHIEVPLRVVEG